MDDLAHRAETRELGGDAGVDIDGGTEPRIPQDGSAEDVGHRIVSEAMRVVTAEKQHADIVVVVVVVVDDRGVDPNDRDDVRLSLVVPRRRAHLGDRHVGEERSVVQQHNRFYRRRVALSQLHPGASSVQAGVLSDNGFYDNSWPNGLLGACRRRLYDVLRRQRRVAARGARQWARHTRTRLPGHARGPRPSHRRPTSSRPETEEADRWTRNSSTSARRFRAAKARARGPTRVAAAHRAEGESGRPRSRVGFRRSRAHAAPRPPSRRTPRPCR